MTGVDVHELGTFEGFTCFISQNIAVVDFLLPGRGFVKHSDWGLWYPPAETRDLI